MTAASQLPLPVRLMNASVAALRGAGLPLLPLEPGRVLRRAGSSAGLDDFGDPGFREGLERLCASLEEEAGLTALGRLIARDEILRLLQARATLPLFLVAYQTINFHHYLVDGLIWKVRKKKLRSNLGLQGGQ